MTRLGFCAKLCDKIGIRHRQVQEFDSAPVKAKDLLEEIERIGAEPFNPPDPLPPIEPDEVHLVCWLAIQSQ